MLDTLKEAGLPEDGKIVLRDGRAGEPFDNPVMVGYIYAEAAPLGGRQDSRPVHQPIRSSRSSLWAERPNSATAFRRDGGVGSAGLRAAYTLQEMLTVKSDDVVGRVKLSYEAIVKVRTYRSRRAESFKVLIKELQSLALDVRVLSEDAQEVTIREDEEDISEMARELGIDIQGRDDDEIDPIFQRKPAADDDDADADEGDEEEVASEDDETADDLGDDSDPDDDTDDVDFEALSELGIVDDADIDLDDDEILILDDADDEDDD